MVRALASNVAGLGSRPRSPLSRKNCFLSTKWPKIRPVETAELLFPFYVCLDCNI